MKKIKLVKPKQKAKIVVGAGYGDEGKGLTTNWLCENTNRPIVVRFSGGQQAGHTVVKNGVKHTFSNYGAGTLSGIPTYFSEHTTFYPVGIKYEKQILVAKGILHPQLIIHPMAKLTTPWDIYENRQCSENLSHGSCGYGVGKTMKRNEGTLKLVALDLFNKDILRQKLSQIEKSYHARGFKDSPELSKEISEFFLAIEEDDFHVDDYSYLRFYETIIFEGSQGIMLDMDHGIFPNVTYANTTSKNAMEICDKLNIKKREVLLVTRAYSTRHGKGNGEYEGDPVELTNTKEETNIFNKFQGDFLTTKINYDRLSYAILVEKIYSHKYQHSLVVTCNNQIVNEKDAFDVELLFDPYSFKHVYKSYSPEGNLERVFTDS